jgi:hypothetical protein
MDPQYRAAINCNVSDISDWYDSATTALRNAGLTLNENNYGDILRVLNNEIGFDTDSKEIREKILDKLSRIVKEHLGESQLQSLLNSDCNFLVSDPTDLNARSNLPGAGVHGETNTITGDKVEDLIIFRIYPFLNPYEQGLLGDTGDDWVPTGDDWVPTGDDFINMPTGDDWVPTGDDWVPTEMIGYQQQRLH